MAESEPKKCAKCQNRDPGPGGVLCPTCLTEIQNMLADYWPTA
ncbi:hypothetical protein [Amycolatopsis sp. cmx-11-32]